MLWKDAKQELHALHWWSMIGELQTAEALERQSFIFPLATLDFKSSIAKALFSDSTIMNTAVLTRMQPILRQPLMRFQAMKQPLQRQPLLRTSRPFHSSRTMLRVKASIAPCEYDVSKLTVLLPAGR
jgi:hypothetical protein